MNTKQILRKLLDETNISKQTVKKNLNEVKRRSCEERIDDMLDERINSFKSALEGDYWTRIYNKRIL